MTSFETDQKDLKTSFIDVKLNPQREMTDMSQHRNVD